MLKKFCRKHGCKNLVEEGWCEAHQSSQASYDINRGTATSRGYTYKWTQYSIKYRKRNPLCVTCLKAGLIVVSGHVDHIIAVKGPNDPLFWEPKNHQALCHGCHSRKTVKEDGGFRR